MHSTKESVQRNENRALAVQDPKLSEITTKYTDGGEIVSRIHKINKGKRKRDGWLPFARVSFVVLVHSTVLFALLCLASLFYFVLCLASVSIYIDNLLLIQIIFSFGVPILL